MEELKNCPFCGGEAELYGRNISTGFGVFCTAEGCEAQIYDMYKVKGEEYSRMRSKEEAIQLWNTRTHPQREALDEEKVRKIIDKIAIVVDGEIKFLPLTTIYEITKEICSLSLPSLSDLLSALPEKIDNITPTLMNANHVCDCYNMAIDACIAALTKRMEELNEKN